MISFNGKYIKNMGAYHGFEKLKYVTMTTMVPVKLTIGHVA